MAITFEKPPIDEVVVGRVFGSRPDLTAGHVGKFWGLVEAEFPQYRGMPPVMDPPTMLANGEIQILVANHPSQRAWFVSAEQTQLLQLQHDRFYYNWRQLTDKTREYIRFEKIFAGFSKYSQILDSFVVSQLATPLKTVRLDLTYINVFKKGVDWNDTSDLRALFKDFDFISQFEKLGRLEQGFIKFDIELRKCPGKMALTIGSARNNETQQPVLRMELAAQCPADQLRSSEEEWYQLAHDAIVEGFCEVTSIDAQQRLWKRTS
jgi:uncharacterized protein (TIGR04255 family)